MGRPKLTPEQYAETSARRKEYDRRRRQLNRTQQGEQKSAVESFEAFCRAQEHRLLCHLYDPSSNRFRQRVIIGTHGPVPAEYIEVVEQHEYVIAMHRYSVLGPELQPYEKKPEALKVEVRR